MLYCLKGFFIQCLLFTILYFSFPFFFLFLCSLLFGCWVPCFVVSYPTVCLKWTVSVIGYWNTIYIHLALMEIAKFSSTALMENICVNLVCIQQTLLCITHSAWVSQIPSVQKSTKTIAFTQSKENKGEKRNKENKRKNHWKPRCFKGQI